MMRLIKHTTCCTLLVFSSLVTAPGECAEQEKIAGAAAQKDLNRKALKGIGHFLVSVHLKVDGQPFHDLSQEQLQTDVELRLRKAGVRFITPNEKRVLDGNFAMMATTVALGQETPGTRVRSAMVKVTVLQLATLEASGEKTLVTTNEYSIVSIAGRGDDGATLRSVLADQVDQLLNDYFAANPKP